MSPRLLAQLLRESRDVARYWVRQQWGKYRARILIGAIAIAACGYVYIERPYLNEQEHDAYRIESLEAKRIRLRSRQMSLYADLQDLIRRTADPAIVKAAAAEFAQHNKELNAEISEISSEVSRIKGKTYKNN